MRHILIMLFLFSFKICSIHEEAVIIVPVADLIGQPLSSYELSSYQDFPLCCRQLNNSYNGCPRLHQSLYNEKVTVLETRENEVCISIPQLFYLANHKKQTVYWTRKNNIVTCKELKKRGVDITKIPAPLSFKSPHTQQKNIVTLTNPWFDSHTNLFFSAGTRFVINKKSAAMHNNQIEVFVLHPQTLCMETILIDKNICLINPPMEPGEKRKYFIHLLHSWVSTDCFIPYVWGGSSFVSCSHSPVIEEKEINTPKAYFSLADCQDSPKSGFDCAGLVSRAAQIAGIPYFYKNTSTLMQSLKPITQLTALQIGDLLWIPGHVMIVSDIKNNLLIEARSYHHGYGKVQEIALENVFKNIKTYEELFDAWRTKKPIVRIDNNGNSKEELTRYTFLSLM